MKIVVFGCDNSGKTTLCKELANKLNFNLVNPLGPASLNEQISYMIDNLPLNGNVIFDRFPIIEEYSCGKVLRGKGNFDEVNAQIIKAFMDKVDLFVFCNPGFEFILNWGEREQMSGIKENIIPLQSRYAEVYRDLLMKNKNVLEYNWTKDKELEKVINVAKVILNNQEGK